MNYREGDTVQSLVDRGAPSVTIVKVKVVLGVTYYLCSNGKYYIKEELGGLV